MKLQLDTSIALVIIVLKLEICLSLCPSPLYKSSQMTESNGICYELITFYHLHLTWYEARVKCAENKGQLAKVTKKRFSDRKNSALRKYLSSFYPDYCVWIGMSDLEEEGNWKWLDGTSAIEGENLISEFLTNWFWDCGLLCYWHDTKSPTWTKGTCTTFRGFICQYKALSPPTPAIPPMKSEDGNDNKDRRREAIQSRKIKTASKVRDGYRVAGPPVFSTRTHSVSLCLRLCVDECRYFNYNLQTKQCEGFTEWRKTDLHVNKDDEQHWEFWEIRYK